uniref:Reverse transcriptase Ty1/copia-type domain-containing protein n=1 Tax=Strongyloides venezuelensis TaxID=75913 RepID=A0A0K0FED5_STRVS
MMGRRLTLTLMELDEHVRLNIEKQIEKGWLEPVPVLSMIDNINSMVIVKKTKLKILISLYDILSAFNGIDVEENFCQYLVLEAPYGMFRSKVLVFGLKLSLYI